MRIVIRRFKNKTAAEAFSLGVEFVNDSALEVQGVTQEKGRFVVTIHDSDGEDDEIDDQEISIARTSRTNT
jgi:hypothetical protein